MYKPIKFLKQSDQFARSINDAANQLFVQIRNLDVDALEMDPFCKGYFKECHSGRLIFSLQCSAHIIYDSVKISAKDVSDLTFIDYGAGLGTLFMLAAKLPFKQVMYTDHLPEWCSSADVICKAFNIPIKDFVEGDIDELVDYCNSRHIIPDIIASRNVIEHIYDLKLFYTTINVNFPDAIVYSTTTANKQNPAMQIRHLLLHRKMEKKYFLKQREELIRKLWPDINEPDLAQLIRLTRGKAMKDFDLAVLEYKESHRVTPPPFLHSNTCDSTTGVWAENLLSSNEHRYLIESSNMKMITKPGFWDTNYINVVMKAIGTIMNGLTSIAGKSGAFFSSFVCIIAIPRSDKFPAVNK